MRSATCHNFNVILLLILEIYLNPMMNMRLIIVFAILLKVVLEECLIRLQCIYNFLLFHAILYPVLDIIGLYYTLLYYFWD